MIKYIIARNPKNEIIQMELSNPWSSGLNVKNVTGISPVGAEIYSTPFASIDGGIFAGARVPSRQIVMTIGLVTNPAIGIDEIEDARLTVYNFFRIKDKVNLVFVTSNRILQIDGYTKDNDVDIFSEKETATVTVECIDPWFYSAQDSSKGFSGTNPQFEFPFSSEEGSTNYTDLLEFGNISIDTRTDVMYRGDIQTGFNMSISFLSEDFHNIYFYNMDTRERMNIWSDQIESLTGYPLGTGDTVVICTISGQKSAFLLRNGQYINIISAIDKNSDWIQLTKGNNVFAFASDYGVENIVIDLSWRDAYGGI